MHILLPVILRSYRKRGSFSLRQSAAVCLLHWEINSRASAVGAPHYPPRPPTFFFLLKILGQLHQKPSWNLRHFDSFYCDCCAAPQQRCGDAEACELRPPPLGSTPWARGRSSSRCMERFEEPPNRSENLSCDMWKTCCSHVRQKLHHHSSASDGARFLPRKDSLPNDWPTINIIFSSIGGPHWRA